MFSKCFVIFGLLAVICVQGLSAKSFQEKQDKSIIGDLVEKAKQMIENLKELVQGGISKVIETLRQYISPVEALRKKYLENGLIEIDTDLVEVTTLIDKLSTEATNTGKDISACLEGRQDEIEALREALYERLHKCIDDAADSFLDFIYDKINAYTQISTDILALPFTLAKCLVSGRPISCVASLIEEMTGLLVRIPAEILHTVQETAILMGDLPNRMNRCNDFTVQDAKEKTDSLEKEISDCAKKILNPKLEPESEPVPEAF